MQTNSIKHAAATVVIFAALVLIAIMLHAPSSYADQGEELEAATPTPEVVVLSIAETPCPPPAVTPTPEVFPTITEREHLESDLTACANGLYYGGCTQSYFKFIELCIYYNRTQYRDGGNALFGATFEEVIYNNTEFPWASDKVPYGEKSKEIWRGNYVLAQVFLDYVVACKESGIPLLIQPSGVVLDYDKNEAGENRFAHAYTRDGKSITPSMSYEEFNEYIQPIWKERMYG